MFVQVFDFPKNMIFLDHHWNLEVSSVKRMVCQDFGSLCRFSSKSYKISAFPLKPEWKASNFKEKQWTSVKICKHWSISIFEIPKQFIRGHNANIDIHKRFPRPAGYKLQATGGRLQATGNSPQARSNRAAGSFRLQARGHKQQATSCRLQATGCKHHVWGWP